MASDFMKRIRNISILVLCLANLAGLFMYPRLTISTLLPMSAFAILVISLIVKHFEKKELVAALGHVRGSTDQLIEQINMNYKNALVVNDIGLALSKQMSTEDILESVVRVLQNRLDYGRGMIMLANSEKTTLYFRTGFGYTEHQYTMLKSAAFHLDKKESRGVFIRAFHEQKPFLVNNVEDIADSLSSRSLQFVKALGTKSFICCPIIYEGESIGVLAVDNLNVKRPLVQSDLNLLMGIAPEIGISIHNANLILARKRQFDSILKTLAASIDARDFLTAGHSEKVTEYAVGICREMGMSDQECEVIRVASLLHDYGKIGIKDSILKKRGALTAEEYAEIKTHSQKTKVILMQIGFEGIYAHVPEIAGAHHEKVDGTGYPNGLKGDEIPIGARIIAVADFFEAVTAKRHYRGPIPVDVALQMLNELRDIHYDAEVIDAFMKYFNKRRRTEVGVVKEEDAGLYRL
jgi:HD-GYP domain-containing protein (c-di-GMP phosphodiesterase class II)